MEKKIETGNTVKLKSGGPIMSVGKIDGENITCTWFDKNGKCKMWTFEEAQLEIIEKNNIRF